MNRICVLAGSKFGTRPEYRTGAEQLGRVLVHRGIELVYGGARVGLMGVVADAVLAGGGRVTGVIPETLVAREIAHTGLDDLRIVDTMHERKATMADLSDGFVALPGGWGTFDELFEILTWAQLGLHGKPIGVLNVEGYFDPLLSLVTHSINEGFVPRSSRAMISAAADAESLLTLMASQSSQMSTSAQADTPPS